MSWGRGQVVFRFSVLTSDPFVLPLIIIPLKFCIFNFKGIMQMCASTSNTPPTFVADGTSTATPKQVYNAIARSVKNEHWIATNG